MPTTTNGLTYPASSGHTRIWEHMQTLAEDVDDFVIGRELFVRKTAAESVTSSTTLQNDDTLTLTVVANATYLVNMNLRYDGASAGDFKFAFALPSGATFDGTVVYGIQVAGGTAGGEATALAFRNTEVQTNIGALGAGTFLGATVIGNLAVSATAGSFTLQWAQNTSSGTATRVVDGSHLSLRRVA